MSVSVKFTPANDYDCSHQTVFNYEYISFRANVPLRQISTDELGKKPWLCYDAGPKSLTCAIIFLPPVCGHADCFYKQLFSLSVKGYRAIALEWSPHWNTTEWCNSLAIVLDFLCVKTAHFFGSSLGGFLAQKFVEIYPRRVVSLILCNSFTDTTIFDRHNEAHFYWAIPGLLLKTLVLNGICNQFAERDIGDSIDFMINSLNDLSQKDLASRMTLNCYRQGVYDDCALTRNARDLLRHCYPEAKRAHLKSGGNFPFLSRSDEVDMHIQIHLRLFENSKYSAREE